MLIYLLTSRRNKCLDTRFTFFKQIKKNPVIENNWFFAFQSLWFSRWHHKTSMKVNCSTHCSFTALNSYTCLQTSILVLFPLHLFPCYLFSPKERLFLQRSWQMILLLFFCEIWWWPRGGNKACWICCLSSQFSQNKNVCYPFVNPWVSQDCFLSCISALGSSYE